METFKLAQADKVYVYDEPVNMGKSFNGLCEIVEKKMKRKVLNGDLFFFFSKKKTYVKILFWSKNGLCIFAKKLPASFYDTENIEGKTISIKEMQNVLNDVQLNKPIDIADLMPKKKHANPVEVRA